MASHPVLTLIDDARAVWAGADAAREKLYLQGEGDFWAGHTATYDLLALVSHVCLTFAHDWSSRGVFAKRPRSADDIPEANWCVMPDVVGHAANIARTTLRDHLPASAIEAAERIIRTDSYLTLGSYHADLIASKEA